MRRILTGMAMLAAGASLGGCNRERPAEANADIEANAMVVEDNLAIPADENGAMADNAAANAAENAADNAADNATDHGSTDHGSTDH